MERICVCVCWEVVKGWLEEMRTPHTHTHMRSYELTYHKIANITRHKVGCASESPWLCACWG